MGYTNYWTQKTNFTDNEWKKVKMNDQLFKHF